MPEVDHVSENTLFEKYDLGKLLGCGGFAKVYHARNVQTSQSVAIKVINKKKILDNPKSVNSIKREISIMSKLNHPNIVKLFEVLATKSKIYFVMEFVKGGELFSKVAKGRFSENLSRKYFQQLISAVGYCHARGVYHRDLKPENLLIDEHGNLKVTDFGLSALTCQVKEDGLLYTSCGTPAYVAPEILLKKGYDGAKIDIWSCGVVLFVLNSGYLPFNDQNLMCMYKKIINGEYKCPKHTSVNLQGFLTRLLDINPETRITIDGILHDSWFKKGCKEIKFYDDDFDLNVEKDEEIKCRSLNAFDIISFSSGLDLSGMFDNNVDDIERFVSCDSAEKLLEKIEGFGKVENLRVKKKEWRLELGGAKGSLVVGVEVYQLMENLFVVEAKRRNGDETAFKNMWNNKLKPFLNVSGASSSTSSHECTKVSGNWCPFLIQ